MSKIFRVTVCALFLFGGCIMADESCSPCATCQKFVKNHKMPKTGCAHYTWITSAVDKFGIWIAVYVVHGDQAPCFDGVDNDVIYYVSVGCEWLEKNGREGLEQAIEPGLLRYKLEKIASQTIENTRRLRRVEDSIR